MTLVSEKQISFIEDLAWKLEREIAPGTFESLSRTAASYMIDDMLDKVRELPKAMTPKAQSTPSGGQFDSPVIGKGYYTVTDDEGHRTFRVSPDQKWADGKTVISLLVGPSNEFSYKGVGFVTNTGVSLWKAWNPTTPATSRIANMIDRLVADAEGALQLTLTMAAQHVLNSSNCFVCGKLLTDPTSIEMGIGPICRGA